MALLDLPDGVAVTGEIHDRYEEILTREALGLIATLHREYGDRRDALLLARTARAKDLIDGGTLDFAAETAEVRAADWSVAEPAPGLVDRRVEMTGPTDRKMTINALNSGAKVWLADLEDANTPLWENMIGGQLNLLDASRRQIDFSMDKGKSYALKTASELATVVVRPRGWHLPEKHLTVDNEPVAGALVDFALYFFHCAQLQIDAGRGPYFYLPKIESHLEARLWNEVFITAQQAVGIPVGTIRATVLIETIPAAFEMEEILYELRQHSAGLNAGRWDYLFSIIKKFRTRGEAFVLPDRNAVTMAAPFMRAYTDLLVQTCHKRGAHAIGGMAAFIPSRKDQEINTTALAKVTEDKKREAGNGFDGSWVAHPDLVPVCREVFDGVLGENPNQRDNLRSEVAVSAAELLDIASTPGKCTRDGLSNAVSVGLQYLASWLAGSGAVNIFNLMEDAATAEISRSQIWQWIHNEVKLDSGETVTRSLVETIIEEELEKLDNSGSYADAKALFTEVALADDFVEFLTLPAYDRMP